MLSLTKYQGIIFDMDGTLIDSMGAHLQAWELTCQAFGYPFDYDYMYGLGGVPTLATVDILNEKFGLSHNADEIAQQKHQFWLGLNQQPEIITEDSRYIKLLPWQNANWCRYWCRPRACH